MPSRILAVPGTVASLCAGQGPENIIYIAVGAGFGGGAVVNGKLVQGLLLPKMECLPVRLAAAMVIVTAVVDPRLLVEIEVDACVA